MVAQKTPDGRGYAVSALPELHQPDDYLPWDSQPLPQHDVPFANTNPPGNALSDLPVFDSASPLIIPSATRLAPRRFRSERGVGGEIGDIHRILQACLQLGQLDRAIATLRRLNEIYRVDSVELVEAHNAYIGALVARIVITKDQALLKQVHKWVQVDMRANGIQPNDVTFALIIQASLHDVNENKIGRTIRRYLALSNEMGIYDEARIAILSRLSDQEAAKVALYDETSFNRPEDLPVESSGIAAGESSPNVLGVPPAALMYDSPEVRSQAQKGLGLVALQKSLAVFKGSTPNVQASDISPEKNQNTLFRQIQLEQDTVSSALDRWRLEHSEASRRTGAKTSLQSKSIGSLIWTWHEALVLLIAEEVKKVKAQGSNIKGSEANERAVYGPFLQYITPEKLSATTIITCLQCLTKQCLSHGMSAAGLVNAVGSAVEDESSAEVIKAQNKTWMSKKGGNSPKERSKRLMRLLRNHQRDPSSKRKLFSSKLGQRALGSATDLSEWSTAIRAKVGATLIAMLIRVAKIDVPVKNQKSERSLEQQPALLKTMQYVKGGRIGMVQMHEAMAEKLRKEPVGSAIVKHLPMLVEPRPWKHFRDGGFLHQPVSVVRLAPMYNHTREYIKTAAGNGDLEKVFAALDILGRTPWRINRPVFDVMLQAWNTGEAIAKIPPEKPDFEYPTEPASKEDKAARKQYTYQVKRIDNLREGMHSNRCFQNFQLEIAKAFLNETFYFPHNMDFRGRAYPIPPYLNHMGADHCRGLLIFGKGKELGEKGLEWLRVHLANVYGYDKASFVERRDFASKHMSEIYDSAVNPLGGQRWWLKAEDPWQCLATCIELRNALESPDPIKYISHLPIHQDGTCNGLQHYAALGGDSLGARQVNLEPGERPSDIYTAVAQMVQEKIRKDADQGSELAKLLDGKATRKVVKQTVMTNVYGVTYAGARRQVQRQLEDLYPAPFASDPRISFESSAYIAKEIFHALSTIFNGAHSIQYWLGECASRICEALTPDQIQWIKDNAAGKKRSPPFNCRAVNEKSLADEDTRFKTSVIWTTPLKMPVVQPYRKSRAKRVTTNLNDINLVEPSASDPVSKRKQLQAFPPNFIHSLDATHMLLSALKCDEAGLSFAAVHDSFWTHAADVDTMNTILRDAFIRMHSEDIIGRLAAEFSARYRGGMYLASVKHNSILGRKIFESRKAARMAGKSEAQIKTEELLIETRRLELLASDDPKQRAEGEKMATAGKLFEETADEKDLMFLEDLEGAIGEIQDRPSTSSSTIDPSAESAVMGEVDAPLEAKDTSILPEDGEEQLSDLDAAKAVKARRALAARKYRKVWVWRPLTFPPVPQRGDFDVSRLRNSKYFFS